jgi:hypothetical protein
MYRQLTMGLVALLGVPICAGVALANGGDPTVDWWAISGGGAPSSGTDVILNDTLGQPVIYTASSGDTSLSAGYWGACAATAAVPSVSITRSGANVVLTWAASPNNIQYQIWISTDPYFNPDQPGSMTPIATADTTYTDTGAAGSLTNHFYVVRGVNACAAASANSGRRGEFTFGLTPGT